MHKLQNQGENLRDKEMKIVKANISKFKKNYNIIMEVTPNVFQWITNRKKIYIGWRSYAVYEHISVSRCCKCWRYGHKAKNCRQDNIVCSNCDQNHKAEECKSEEKQCTNCEYACEVLKIPDVLDNHMVFDKNCTIYSAQYI